MDAAIAKVMTKTRPAPAGLEPLLVLLFLAASALFLFLDVRTPPIVLWDESRNVVNALEMRHSGLGLVTTYGFAPDLWNTKPPLLIWLMTGSMALFGPSEWGMRLPSALAALATLLILILFVRRVSGSLGTGIAAAAMLLFSPGFFGESGARTADYDALLLFFITAYLQILFFAVHERRPRLQALLLIGAMIAGAAMTKTIAGLIPGAGVGLYLLVSGRWRRILENWRGYAAVAAIAAVPLLVFYAAREAAAPGYLAAMVHNDLFGRFSQSLIGKTTSPWIYGQELFGGWFSAGPFLFTVPLAFRHLRGKSRVLTIYSLCLAASIILIYTFSSTRLVHYVLPAFPWLAIAAALSLRHLAQRFVAERLEREQTLPALAAAGAGALMLAQIVAQASHWRFEAFPERQFYPEASYGALFADLDRRGASSVTVVDPGFTLETTPYYQPLLRGYTLIWNERGLAVSYVVGASGASGGLVASCDPQVARKLLTRGTNLADVPGCAAVRVTWPAQTFRLSARIASSRP